MIAFLVAAVLLATAGFATVAAQPADLTSNQPDATVTSSNDATLEEARLARAGLGLDATPDVVRELTGSPADVGTERWGIPMTADEASAVDLVGRGEFANLVAREVLPLVQDRPDFAGLWMDPSGNAVVSLTSDDPALTTTLQRIDDGSQWSVTTTRGRRPWAQVEAALEAIRPLWAEIAPRTELLTVRAHAQDGTIIAEVLADDIDQAEAAAGELSGRLAVPVLVRAGERQVDTVCTSRNNCYDPFRAGIVIRNASPTSPDTCTMGFHLNGGEYGAQFITAGHCGAAYSSTKWYHQGGSTYVGGELATLLVNNGIDAMRINITPNSYGDNHMYGDGTFIQSSLSYRNPIAGETLCANLGVSSSASKCGTVTDASISWTSSVTGFTVTGADLSITTVVGDSGSPMHTPGDPGDYVWAIGINDTAGAHFARMGSIMAKPAFDDLLLLYGQS